MLSSSTVSKFETNNITQIVYDRKTEESYQYSYMASIQNTFVSSYGFVKSLWRGLSHNDKPIAIDPKKIDPNRQKLIMLDQQSNLSRRNLRDNKSTSFRSLSNKDDLFDVALSIYDNHPDISLNNMLSRDCDDGPFVDKDWSDCLNSFADGDDYQEFLSIELGKCKHVCIYDTKVEGNHAGFGVYRDERTEIFQPDWIDNQFLYWYNYNNTPDDISFYNLKIDVPRFDYVPEDPSFYLFNGEQKTITKLKNIKLISPSDSQDRNSLLIKSTVGSAAAIVGLIGLYYCKKWCENKDFSLREACTKICRLPKISRPELPRPTIEVPRINLER